ncbi:hypothetical protein [Hymenobacter profundi]|uniref:NlpE C-terminal OB domain-containing protein n=1 Tax=Hymenobacter profundi TaxID=1982110 RepID=A0ABS6X0L3_9BACT|nr:hypothetical protein [Hymenobacter profundi]MBW3128846.1 hypothetical protein [Hymenobacter profundi]
MKSLLTLLAFSSLLLQSCTQDDNSTEEEVTPTISIRGQIVYGAGDCMPAIDEAGRKYNMYTGEVYFIRKQALDQLGNGSFEQLKQASLHYPVKAGKFRAAPPADTYVVVLAEQVANQHVVTVTATQPVVQDFKFWKCLSY